MDYTVLIQSITILLIPVFLALPATIAWKFFTSSRHNDKMYRRYIMQILESGEPISNFRNLLNDRARKHDIRPSRQRLIEANTLHPLRIQHFLILPAILVAPIAALLALPIFGVTLAVLLLIEYVLIKKEVLAIILSLVNKLSSWQVIHLPRARMDHEYRGRENLELSRQIVFFRKVPRSVFLGLFAWLIIHWTLRVDSVFVEVGLSSLLYIFLLAFIGTLSDALETDLAFADVPKTMIIQIDEWVENNLKPLVGLGLVFLISRNLMEEARMGNPVTFSVILVVILYGSAIIGSAYELGYSTVRGEGIRKQFEAQIARRLNPSSYDMRRTHGIIELRPRMKMQERLESFNEGKSRELTFEELYNIPKSETEQDPVNPL